jgi:hypothetical protein
VAQVHTMAAAAERLGFARKDGSKVVAAAENPSSQAAAARFLGARISSARRCAAAVGLSWASRSVGGRRIPLLSRSSPVGLNGYLLFVYFFLCCAVGTNDAIEYHPAKKLHCYHGEPSNLSK